MPDQNGNKQGGHERPATPECGTQIYHQTEWREGTVSVKLGTLDDTRWLKPEMHLWTRSKQPWVIIPEGVEVYEKQPS